MAKKLDKEYCLWKTNCLVFGLGQDLEGCEQYRCCYNCSKKTKCDFACKDRDEGSHTCPFLTSKEEVEAKTTHTINSSFSSNINSKKSKAVVVNSREVSKESPEKLKQKRVTAPKALWTLPLPTTVKELAAQTGSTYARANYLIRTKKISFEEAVEILKK